MLWGQQRRAQGLLCWHRACLPGLQATGLTHAAGAGCNVDHWRGGVQALAVQQEAVVCMQLQVPAGCAHQDAAVLILKRTRLSLHV